MLNLVLGLSLLSTSAEADTKVVVTVENTSKRTNVRHHRRATKRKRIVRKTTKSVRPESSRTTIVIDESRDKRLVRNQKRRQRAAEARQRARKRAALRARAQAAHNEIEVKHTVRIQQNNSPKVTTVENHYYSNPVVEQPITSTVNETSTVSSPGFRKSLSFGLRGGAVTSDLNNGSEDMGLGVSIGYRIFEPLGVELSYVHYGDRIDMATDSPVQASAQLFLFPGQDINPYVSGGVSFAKVKDAKNETGNPNVPDGYGYGPHGGLGVQFGSGNVLVNTELRYSSYSNIEEQGSLQGIVGVDYYF